MRYGDRHHRVRYSDADVELARDLYEEHGIGPREIARKFEAPERTVWDWLMYRTRTGSTSHRTMARRAA